MLDKRIRSQLAEIEQIKRDCIDFSASSKRLFVLNEYRHVLMEDRMFALRRQAHDAIESKPAPDVG